MYCCGGGAGVGYSRAGFEVVGIDKDPQPHYPFDFIRSDIADLDPDWIESFDAIHASPPCQIHSVTAVLHNNTEHVDLIPQTRAMLVASGKPYVIENVVGAPLIFPIMLCGTMFGLRVFRHRLFESNVFMMTPPHEIHRGTTNSRRSYSTHANGADIISIAGNNFNRLEGMKAMGIDWDMPRHKVAQAIPPAYTEFLGRQLMAHIAR